jgi:DNA replication protein DnaC
MNTDPDWYDLMEFTKGKWATMSHEEQDEVITPCKLHLEEARRRAEERAHRQAWDDLCPPEYRNSSRERLPNLEKFEQVQKWQYGPVGLLLVGPTRCGKTRAVWKLLERLHFDEHRNIIAFSPMDLKLAVANAWRDTETTEDWINSLRHVGVLFLDDLDTIKFTEAVEETIYDVFEFRPTHAMPVIATLNQSGRQLAARMNTNGRGAKIVERMREYCQVVNFT